MQAFRAKVYLIGVLIFTAVACTPAPIDSLPPTLIAAAGDIAISTPTLTSSETAVSALPTPSVTVVPGVLAHNGRSIGDPYIPELGNTGYDVQQYHLQLALDPDVKRVTGTAVIEALATAANLSQLSLDFVGFEIRQLTVDGQPAAFAREDKKLLITLPQPVIAGTLFTISISYQGEPVQEPSPYTGFTDALGLGFSDERSIYTLSEPDGARYWFPNNDHPRDKALFRFELTAPVGLTAVANGQLIDIQMADLETLPSGGTGRTFIWEHNYPMSTYLALVSVGPYERIESVSPGGVVLRHYITADVRQDFKRVADVTGDAIDWMSDLFGPYPFEAFGYVTADMPATAMETQTIPILSNELIGQKTAVHEMAHMWFGNWVGLDSWAEMWRKEGLASYIALMWETHDDPELLDQRIENVMTAVSQNSPQYPIGNPPPEHLLGYNTYFKGAAFIHTLRRQMGDEAFFAGLRTYLQRYGGGTASNAQFQATMEEAAGFSLDGLFTEWLN